MEFGQQQASLKKTVIKLFRLTCKDVRRCNLSAVYIGCSYRRVCYQKGVGPPFRGAVIPKGPPFSTISSSDNLRLGLRSVVWLWQYQELFHATTTNDGFQNGGPFGMAALRNGGPEPHKVARWSGKLWKSGTVGARRGGKVWGGGGCPYPVTGVRGGYHPGKFLKIQVQICAVWCTFGDQCNKNCTTQCLI